MVNIMSKGRVSKLWVWGIVAAGFDIAFIQMASRSGISFLLANLIGFLLASLVLLFPCWLKSANDDRNALVYSRGKRILYFIATALLIFFIRGGLLALMGRAWGLSFDTAILPTAVLSDISMAAIGILLFSPRADEPDRSGDWKIITVGLIAYFLVLRILYLGALELMPEETYYWNYSQHLDWGYLDHPPMVAWLIAAGTGLVGTTEFGVRLGAIICWLITSGFMYALSKRIYGRDVGLSAILVLSALPFFFGIGSLMMPDAPLTACWAGAIYFLYQIMMEKKTGGWYGFGICIGLGMISKYTIGALPVAALLFIMFDKESRMWFRKPQPYLATAIALLIFLPVVYWNSEHQWVSFAFQTSRRLNEPSRFSLHLLLGSILVLLTPHGFLAALKTFRRGRQARNALQGDYDSGRGFKLRSILVLVPLIIFVIFSIDHQPKLNWTGPLWLAIIPYYAMIVSQPNESSQGIIGKWLRRSWRTTAVILGLLYGFGLYYLGFGFPGLPYSSSMADIGGWRDLGAKIKTVDSRIITESKEKPLIVGMDKYNISSELAFYMYPDGSSRTAGRSLFGDNGLMYKYWFPDSAQTGKTIIMVGRDSSYLASDQITSHYDSLGVHKWVDGQDEWPGYCGIFLSDWIRV